MALVFSAGIIPIRKVKDGQQYLLLRSYGYWDFPKGKIEPGESHIDAALRETEEESGLSDLSFGWGRVFHETAPYKTKTNGKKVRKISRYYVAEVESGEPVIRSNPESGIKEHEEFRWITFQQSKNIPLHPRIKEVLKWAYELTEQ